jgi:hypothetical protein
MPGHPGMTVGVAWLYVVNVPEPAPNEEAAMSMTTTPSEHTAVLEYRLTAMDRCDSCGAQAYIAAEVNGSELLFCAHHGRKYEEKLRAIATSWHDETARLTEN